MSLTRLSSIPIMMKEFFIEAPFRRIEQTKELTEFTKNDWKDRMIRLLVAKPGVGACLCTGLFALGFSCGALAALVIDRRLKEENLFKDYPRWISRISIVVPTAMGLGGLAAASRVHWVILAMIVFLPTGFVAGLKMAESLYRHRFCKHKIALK